MEKLHISNEMKQLDRKNRKFYDELTPEERKKFGLFPLIRWASTVQADADIQAYYIMSTNENFNKNFFALNKHPKLQWLCATAVSPGVGTFRHDWISHKKQTTATKTERFLRSVYPQLKDDEIELLQAINTEQDIKQLARDHGWDDKRIKSEL
jgi:hypothetical protein